MIKIAIAFLLGCLLCLNLSELPATGWWLALLLAPLIWFRQWLLSGLIVGLLWTGFQAQQRLDEQLPESLAGQTILTQGVIASVPEQHDRLLRFIFEPENPELPYKLRLSWYHPPDLIPAAGERWQLGLRLKPPRGLTNPGSFDYEKWLFAENIGATGYIHQRSENLRLSAAALWHIDHHRQQLQNTLKDMLPEARQAPLFLGLAVGLRDALTQHHWDVLRQTGTSHLLAISGLHIGFTYRSCRRHWFLFIPLGMESVDQRLTEAAGKTSWRRWRSAVCAVLFSACRHVRAHPARTDYGYHGDACAVTAASSLSVSTIGAEFTGRVAV